MGILAQSIQTNCLNQTCHRNFPNQAKSCTIRYNIIEYKRIGFSNLKWDQSFEPRVATPTPKKLGKSPHPSPAVCSDEGLMLEMSATCTISHR